MVRFIYVIFVCFFLIVYYIPKMMYYTQHPEKYTETDCYRLAVKLITKMKKRGRIETKVYGIENLPKKNGYIMFSNHQGKYDALGIMAAHEQPCTVVMEKDKSGVILTKQFINLIRGKRLDRNDIRQQIQVFDCISKEVTDGRRYLIFPEAGYDRNKNQLQEFYAGCFRTAIKAKCPIVPVAIWDSYKPFGENSLKRVITEVHFLEAIPYQDFQGMKTQEIKDLVANRIAYELDRLRKQKGEYQTVSVS